jgi:hypothetical protein
VADPHLKLPRTYQWNATFEQSLGGSQSRSLTYIGAVGRDLLRVSDLVNVNTNCGLIALTGNNATSDYHALQIKFERQLSLGLQALVSYILTAETRRFHSLTHGQLVYSLPVLNEWCDVTRDLDVAVMAVTSLSHPRLLENSPTI